MLSELRLKNRFRFDDDIDRIEFRLGKRTGIEWNSPIRQFGNRLDESLLGDKDKLSTRTNPGSMCIGGLTDLIPFAFAAIASMKSFATPLVATKKFWVKTKTHLEKSVDRSNHCRRHNNRRSSVWRRWD